MSINDLVNLAGLVGLALLAAGLAGIVFSWRWTNYIWVRVGLVVFGAGDLAALVYLLRLEFHVLAYLYMAFVGALEFAHVVALVSVVTKALAAGGAPSGKRALHPLLAKARRAERSLDYVGAIKAYDEYLEKFEDPEAGARLAEALIKSGNSKRAISVLTVAFTQTEEDKLKIALGIRLAEVILVTERDPVGARTQLEHLRGMFKGGENEAYVEELARRMMQRVGEGKYLKAKPDRPHYG